MLRRQGNDVVQSGKVIMNRRCPACGSSNPPSAERCVCGQPLSPVITQQGNEPVPPKKEPPFVRRALIGGIVGFSVMTLQGIISTLDPRPDGRLLNTAPAIGIDIFLVFGILGIIYCAVRLARGRTQ